VEARVKLSKDGTSIDFTTSDNLPTSLKKFRQSPEIEGFYRFIFENDLQKEAFEILERIIQARKAKKGQAVKAGATDAPAAAKVAAKPKAEAKGEAKEMKAKAPAAPVKAPASAKASAPVRGSAATKAKAPAAKAAAKKPAAKTKKK
jgi:hypothetical protein